MEETFGGDKKIGTSLLSRPEKRFVNWAVPKIPTWIQSQHLTLATIPISACIVLSSYLAKFEIQWLWLTSVSIAFQWLTDSLDGAVGRARNTGLVRWGYYMDHFLDYVFLCSILIGYSILLPDRFQFLHFFVLAIFGAFMVNSFLAFAATNEFQVTHGGIGPTEVRIVFIVINTLLIIFGKTYLAPSLPYVLFLSILGLTIVVYRTQRHLWQKDMHNKNTQ